MRALVILVGILATLYSGYWALGHQGITRGLDGAEQSLRDEGAVITYADRDVVGFPSRFDVTYKDISVDTPDIRYDAPLLQVFTLSYKPNHVIAFAPGPHRLSGPFGEATLSSDDLRASVRVFASTDLGLAETRLSGTKIDLVAPGLDAQVQDLSVAVRDATNASYDLFLQADQVGATMLATLVQGSPLPPAISELRVRGQITLDAPIDRQGAATRPVALRIDQGDLTWGDTVVSATADLTYDAAGAADGMLGLRAVNWEPLVDLIESNVPDAPRLRGMMAAAADDNGALNLEFTVKSDQIYFGPFVIGSLSGT